MYVAQGVLISVSHLHYKVLTRLLKLILWCYKDILWTVVLPKVIWYKEKTLSIL